MLVRAFRFTVSFAVCAAATSGCASRFEGSPTAFIYRVDTLRGTSSSCDAAAAAPMPSDTPFFVVRDRGVVAFAIACPTVAACGELAASATPASFTPLWAYAIASFAFREDDPAASGVCKGEGLSVRSNGIGRQAFFMEIAVRRIDSVPREAGTGVCALDVAEGLAATLPCVAARRYDATLVEAR
jgi:hypothetical protein